MGPSSSTRARACHDCGLAGKRRRPGEHGTGESVAQEHRRHDLLGRGALRVDDEALESTLRTLAKALRPDALIMTMAWRDIGEPRATAISKLRDQMWGAGPRPTEAVTAMLERAGFSHIRIGPPMGTMQPILAAARA